MASSRKDQVELASDGSVQKALATFRAPESGPESYVVFSYSDAITINVVAQGKGGLAEIFASLLPTEQCYALLRKDHKVELATTVKFVYIDWTPLGMNPMRKALVSTHKRQVATVMKPFHVDFQASEQSDVDEKMILSKIGMASGTALHVTEKKTEDKKTPSSSSAKPSIPKTTSSTGGIGFVDEEAFKNAMKSLRDANSSVNWLLTRYAAKDKLALISTGSGGLDELATKLESDNANYALLRVIDVIDKHKTVKFCFIKWIPDIISPMKKGELNTRSSIILDIFSPYHVDIHAEKKEDLSQHLIEDMVASASGSKSHVVKK